MTRQFYRNVGAGMAFAAIILAGVIFTSQRGQANDEGDKSEKEKSEIQQGFAIAPVDLNLAHKNRALVGLGSYLVNTGACNDCHTNPAYTKTGNPYLIGVVKKQINAAGYLAGGTTFGPFTSRNLTPDKSGKPLGGASFSDFREIIRTGVDMDQWHLNLPAPLNGKVLQVMPWPAFQDLSDRDLLAIYEYLSAIPCVEGDPGNPAGSDTHGTRCH